ncbi:MAG: ATP-dependent DNA ligase, partial [Aeromicrobium erythreum]
MYAGRVGSGLRDRDLERLDTLLGRLARRTAPVDVPADVAREAHWVTPRVVGEVSFGEWTPSGHLRHPVWRGLRPDRSP